MKLPFLQFEYKDENSINRYCSIVQMPSGCAERGVVDFKIKNGTVQLIINVTHLMIFNPLQYAALFRDAAGNAIYHDNDHVKIHGHHDAVKKLKGSSASNRIFYVFEFKPDITIDGDKVFEEVDEDSGTQYVIPGFQLIKASKGKNPQIFAHFEFKKKSDGHAFAQAQDEEDHLQGDEDDSSSSSSSSSSDGAAAGLSGSGAAARCSSGGGWFGR
jgi:hypothetical protein